MNVYTDHDCSCPRQLVVSRTTLYCKPVIGCVEGACNMGFAWQCMHDSIFLVLKLNDDVHVTESLFLPSFFFDFRSQHQIRLHEAVEANGLMRPNALPPRASKRLQRPLEYAFNRRPLTYVNPPGRESLVEGKAGTSSSCSKGPIILVVTPLNVVDALDMAIPSLLIGLPIVTLCA